MVIPILENAVDVGDTCTKGQVQAMPSLCGRKNNPVITSSLPVWIKHGLDPPSRLLVCPLQLYDAVTQCKKKSYPTKIEKLGGGGGGGGQTSEDALTFMRGIP